MINFKNILKQRLPKSIVTKIKKIRYTKKIRMVTDESSKYFRGMGHLINNGDTVIDIGANMGYYTKILADKVGSQGTVYSIEPIPDSFEMLSHVTKELNLINVRLFNIAISDTIETVTMEIPLRTSGEENLFEAKIVASSDNSSQAQTVKVATQTLDSLFLLSEKRISFIKCDVEGHELACLRGSVSLIEKFKPAWLIEIWGNPDDKQTQGWTTKNFLNQFGYDIYVFDGMQFHLKTPGETDINYFILAENHVEKLRHDNLLQMKNAHEPH